MLRVCLPQMNICQGCAKPKLPKDVHKLLKEKKATSKNPCYYPELISETFTSLLLGGRKVWLLKCSGQSCMFWRRNTTRCALTMLLVYRLQEHEGFQVVQGGTQRHSILLFEGLWTVQKRRGSVVRESKNVTDAHDHGVNSWLRSLASCAAHSTFPM